MAAYHIVTKDEFEKINGLMDSLVGHESRNHPAEIITQLFSLHNVAFPHQPEYSKSCGSCRTRVYNRLKTYWHEMKGQYGF